MFALILTENSRFSENSPPKMRLTTNLIKHNWWPLCSKMHAKLTAHAIKEFTAFTVNWAVLRHRKHQITSWSPERSVRFALKGCAFGLVCLTDTLPKHNGPNTTLKTFYVKIRSLNIFEKNYTFCPEDLSFHTVIDHDNIETICYRDIMK